MKRTLSICLLFWCSPLHGQLTTSGPSVISQPEISNPRTSVYIVNTIAGNYATYGLNGGFAGDGGIPQSAGMYWPCEMVLDKAGNLYVVDLWNDRIRVINMQSTTRTLLGVNIPAGAIQTVAGASATNGFAGDGGSATAAGVRMGHPVAAAFDPSGNLYIADQQNGAIRRVSSTGILSTIVGTAQNNYFPGDNVPISFPLTAAANASGGSTSYTGTFSPVPTAGTYIYVQGFSDGANNGRFKAQKGSNKTTLILNNASGVAEAHAATANYAALNWPQGVAVDARGNLIIADSNSMRVRAVNMQSTAQTIFGVSIPAGYIKTIAGNGATSTYNATVGSYGGDGGPATIASLYMPLGIGLDLSGNLYISDYGNNIIRKVTPEGTISTYAGSVSTVAIASVSNGGGNSVYSYTLTSGPPLTVGSTVNVKGCPSVHNNDSFKITALGTGTFTVVNTSGVTESTPGATGRGGIEGYSGDGGLATGAELRAPYDVKADNSGNVYIADTRNNLIRRVSATGDIETIAGDFSAYGTKGGYAGDGNLAGRAGFGETGGPQGNLGPVGILPDNIGNIFVGDTGNNVVRKLMPAPVPGPTVTRISESTGTENDALTITGTGFMLNATVLVGTQSASSVVVVSPTTIKCAVPAGSGTVGVTVRNATGQAGMLGDSFTYKSFHTTPPQLGHNNNSRTNQGDREEAPCCGSRGIRRW